MSSSCQVPVKFLSSSCQVLTSKKSVGGEDIHRLIKIGFSVSGNDFLAYIHRVGDQRTVLRHKSQIDVNSVANPIGRIRKTHALIASARRNHVVDGNTIVGIVNQRHREVSIRSVASSAVVAPRQCDLTLVIQQLNVQRQLETTLRHHHLRVINAKIRRNFIGFRNAIAKANFPRCANCFGLRASFTLRAIPLFLAKCYPCSFVSSVGIFFLPRICFLGSRQCVRDWSGILLERSGKRYSGKPDGDSRNALLFKV